MRARARQVGIALACAAVVAAGTTAALPEAATAATGDRTITVFLKPGDDALLTRLADGAGPLTASRRAALERALPSAADHQRVEDALRDKGFAVTDVTAWSVTAKAPAGVVGTLFGVASSVTGLLGAVPKALAPLVGAAFEEGVGGPAVRSHALTGADFRNAYTSPKVAPYSGKYRGARPTIATIQFSGWDRGDLAAFAKRNKLPYAASTLTQVPVKQSTVPTKSDGDGAIEVALDQEAILATNPYARQRAYFAPNTDVGFAGAFSQVLTDVLAKKGAYRGGDRNITALSVSWGQCETASTKVNGTVNTVLKSLTAAGVTVFAASGDSGAYDCGTQFLSSSPKSGTDFPAASPYVIGVGGTSLSRNPGGVNNGHNWTETAWSCDGSTGCAGGLLALSGGSGGSGGGVSTTFDRPAYQSSLGGSGRMVPDIAGIADPDNGFTIYTSQQSDPWLTVGGTSLAAPVEAALFTGMLAAHGITTAKAAAAVGNVHHALYGAAGSSAAFRDITSGTNYYTAGRGYDLVTGLGAPLWPAIGQRVFGTSKLRPAVRWSVQKKSGRRTVALRWDAGKRGFAASVTLRSPNGTVLARRAMTAPKGAISFRGYVGKRYRAAISVVDKGHRISPVHGYAFTMRR